MVIWDCWSCLVGDSLLRGLDKLVVVFGDLCFFVDLFLVFFFLLDGFDLLFFFFKVLFVGVVMMFLLFVYLGLLRGGKMGVLKLMGEFFLVLFLIFLEFVFFFGFKLYVFLIEILIVWIGFFMLNIDVYNVKKINDIFFFLDSINILI